MKDMNGKPINPGDLVVQLKGHECYIGRVTRVIANVTFTRWSCGACNAYGTFPAPMPVALIGHIGLIQIGVPGEWVMVINGEENSLDNDARREREERTVRRLHREAWTARKSLQDQREQVERARVEIVRNLRARTDSYRP